ncbi:MAG: VanZ family protein [Saprospiraceae bacterium]|nr:VanZ family protein [Saprospiraceae bacterium]
MNRKYLYYLPAIIAAIIIYSLSTNTNVQLPKTTWVASDKIAHLGVYAIFHLIIVWGMLKQQVWQKIHWNFVLLSLVIASSYGVLMEWVQLLTPGRVFDYADMFANIIGTIVGTLILPFIKKYMFRIL